MTLSLSRVSEKSTGFRYMPGCHEETFISYCQPQNNHNDTAHEQIFISSTREASGSNRDTRQRGLEVVDISARSHVTAYEPSWSI